MTRKTWTADETAYLKAHYATLPATEIAAVLERTVPSVQARASGLHLRKGRGPRPLKRNVLGLSARQMRLLEVAAPGRSATQVAAVMGLTVFAVREQLKLIYRSQSCAHLWVVLLRAERAGLLQGINV